MRPGLVAAYTPKANHMEHKSSSEASMSGLAQVMPVAAERFSPQSVESAHSNRPILSVRRVEKSRRRLCVSKTLPETPPLVLGGIAPGQYCANL